MCPGKDSNHGRLALSIWRAGQGVSAQNSVGLIMGRFLGNSVCQTLQNRKAREEKVLLKEKQDVCKRKDLGGPSEMDRSSRQINNRGGLEYHVI